jgi:hypothetical protein
MKNRAFLTIVVLATLAYWALLIFRIPLFQNLPWWFWDFRDTALSSPLFPIGSAGLAALVLAFVLTNPAKHKLNLTLLIVMGYTLHVSFGFVEGRGVDAFRERLTKTGHIDCIKVAAKGFSAWDLATRYEEYLEHTELWNYDYLKTKPPGTVLSFVLAERVTGFFSQPASEEVRLQRFVTLAAFLLPLLATLAVIPLFFLSRLFLKKETAILPVVLFLFTPSVNLISMYVDHFLLPFLCLLCVWLSAASVTRRNLYLVSVAGMLTFASTYTSFSMLALIPLCPLVMTGMWFTSDRANRSWKDLAQLVAAFLAVYIVMLVVFRIVLNYDMVLRFSKAIAAHEDIKSWAPGIHNVITFAFVDYVEFACGVGIPLAVVFLDQLSASVQGIVRKDFDAIGLLSLALGLILLGLGLFGKTKGETARLWLFLIPLVCIVAAGRLSQRFQNKVPVVAVLIAILLFATAILMKRYEDLWRAIA